MDFRQCGLIVGVCVVDCVLSLGRGLVLVLVCIVCPTVCGSLLSGAALMMMMSFIRSCRNKNQPKDIYPKGTSHHTRLFRGPSTNGMKK